MEPWQKDLVDIIETLADETERFFLGMSDMVEAFFELTGELTEQLHTNLITESENYLFPDLTEPILEICWELEDLIADSDVALPYSVTPTPEQHPACIGCMNYHGQVYGGNLLVCGMHPQGRDDENCPDWEKYS